MQRTYELYARRRDQAGEFRVVTCHEHALVFHAQELLAQEGVQEVEVREGGQPLFTLVK